LELSPQPGRQAPSRLAAVAVTLCGVCAFLELYCTQPLLPLLAQIFHASKTGVGLTVSAATLAINSSNMRLRSFQDAFAVPTRWRVPAETSFR